MTLLALIRLFWDLFVFLEFSGGIPEIRLEGIAFIGQMLASGTE